MLRLSRNLLRKGDKDFSSYLLSLIETNPHAKLELHKSCYCTYTSRKNRECTLKKHKLENSEDYIRVRRSQVVQFDIMLQCLFCTDICKPKDPVVCKNPHTALCRILNPWRSVKKLVWNLRLKERIL